MFFLQESETILLKQLFLNFNYRFILQVPGYLEICVNCVLKSQLLLLNLFIKVLAALRPTTTVK